MKNNIAEYTTPSSNINPAPAAVVTQPVASANKSGFNFYINGFRGFCVLLVFAYHVVHSGLIPPSTTSTAAGNAFLFFASSWRYGVELFFMISGFVIINSLRRHNTIAAFLMDRCIRIFPVWVPVHLCIFFLGMALGWKYFANTAVMDKFAIFIANLLLLPPLVPIPVLHPASWSLSYEWLFYLSAAAICALLVRRWNTSLRVVGSVLLSLIIIELLMLLPRGLFFIPGVIVALNWQAIRDSHFLRSSALKYPMLGLIVFLISWRVVNLDEARPTATAITQVLSWPGIAWGALAFLSGQYLFICVCNGIGAARRLNHVAMQTLGNVSYSFYLWHPIAMFAVKKPIVTWLAPHTGWLIALIVFVVTSFTLALLLSITSYQLIEQKLAKRLRSWMITQHAERTKTSSRVAIAVGHEGGV